jgi:hypothetical protein
MSCHNLVKLSDASCWPTTRSGKRVKQPSVFKITHEQLGSWHVISPMHYFPCCWCHAIWVWTNLHYCFDNNWYDVTIGNFPKCSCVYFVKMLAKSLGAHGVYVQCKHVYHILQTIMFCGLTKEFIHYCTWSWDEVQCLLECSKAFGFSW